jgi:hypothetical protein
MVAGGKLTISLLSFGMTITTTLNILLGTAFATTAAAQEQCKKEQKYTPSDRTADDVLVVVR